MSDKVTLGNVNDWGDNDRRDLVDQAVDHLCTRAQNGKRESNELFVKDIAKYLKWRKKYQSKLSSLKPTEDICVVVRRSISNGQSVLYAFGTTAPGTYAALCDEAQEKLCSLPKNMLKGEDFWSAFKVTFRVVGRSKPTVELIRDLWSGPLPT